MQTCVKDGKITMVMSYEEWQDLYPIIDKDRLSKPMVVEINNTQQLFSEMLDKEITKVPDYLRRVIEMNTIVYPNIIPIKKEMVR